MTDLTSRWEIALPWDKPPLTLNQRMHWAPKAQWTRTLRAGSHLLALQAKIPQLDTCTVTLLWHPPDRRRRDEDNPIPTLKALADGVVDAGVVTDDTPDLMRKHCRIGEVRRPQRLLLVIERGLR